MERVNQRRWNHLHRDIFLKKACVLLCVVGGFCRHKAFLRSQVRPSRDSRRSLRRHQRRHVPPGCTHVCVPTALEHFGAVWSPHDSAGGLGIIPESFASLPSLHPLLVYTSNISTPDKNSPLQSHMLLVHKTASCLRCEASCETV